jgi:tetratricopeptide (TPR) repeat protein
MYKLGKIDRAKNYIESAIRYGAYTNSEVLEHYGDIMVELSRCVEALEAYQNILEIDSSDHILEKIKNVNLLCE